ncbi:hypothetical protein C8F01DRAFT_1237448 [Mycena amicta]|nr:hypothetical protein C8F01DRAFT_1237448 [Mycena amicta]
MASPINLNCRLTRELRERREGQHAITTCSVFSLLVPWIEECRRRALSTSDFQSGVILTVPIGRADLKGEMLEDSVHPNWLGRRVGGELEMTRLQDRKKLRMRESRVFDEQIESVKDRMLERGWRHKDFDRGPRVWQTR